MKKSCFFAAAFLVFGGAATAQVANDSISAVELDRVTVTAPRAGERTPVAHTNLSREEIARVNNGVDMPFMLTMTPSVVAASDAGNGIGYTSLSIRGTDGTRINVTANGVPLNDGESHKLYWVNLPDFASSAGEVQIQRGVGTSTNGAGAFGGSVDMTTEPLSLKPFAELTAGYGSYNTHREVLRFGTGLLGGRWAFSGRLSNIGSDGYVDRASARLRSFFAQGGWFGRSTTVKLIAFGGGQATYHAWNGLTQEQIDTYGRRYNTAGEIERTDRFGNKVKDADGNVVEGFYPDQKDFYDQYHVHLIVGQSLGESWNLALTGHYTRGDGYYEEYKNRRSLVEYGLENYFVEGVEVTRANLIRRKRMWNDFGGAIASASYSGANLEASLGAAWNRYAGDHYGQVVWIKNYVGDELPPAREYYRNTTIKDDANAFARADWSVARGLSLYGDLQLRAIGHRIEGRNDNYDWINGAMQRLDVDRTYVFFNPKAGVYYEIDPSNAVYASVGIAHKEPTRNDFTDAEFGAIPRAERLIDYEIGYKLSAGRVEASANLYYMRYRDQLLKTGRLNDIGEALAANVPASFRMGAELTFGVRLAEWFRWDVFGTFSRNRILDYTLYLPDIDPDWEYIYNPDGTYSQTAIDAGDTTIGFSPSVIAGNVFSFRTGGFYGALQTNYVSSQYLTNAQNPGLMLPRYCVTNLRASYRFHPPAMRFLEVGVAVNNIFNARYSSFGFGYSSLLHAAGGTTEVVSESGYFPQATANVMASVTLAF